MALNSIIQRSLRLLETFDALSFVVETSQQAPFQKPMVAVDVDVPLPNAPCRHWDAA